MYINLFNVIPGTIQDKVWIEERKDINSPEELKQAIKKIFSAMKKNAGWNDVSVQLCSDSGFYVVVDRYDAESESFRTIFHERWNSEDKPVMRAQKNVMKYAEDIFKGDELSKKETA